MTLSTQESVEPSLQAKLDQILRAATVENAACRDGAAPHRPVHSTLGPVLRASFWNIERGYEFDLIRNAFADSRAFLQASASGLADPERRRSAAEQLEALRLTDVLVLNEADIGVSRTRYRHIARDLAAALDMNYAFGVEFVEVDPIALGLGDRHVEDKEEDRALQEELRVDRDRYQSLHGNAILSRYPILGARIVRLPECYDWYGRERKEIAALEKGKRWSANKVFAERVRREVRRGGRMALIAELAVPESPTGEVTVVSVHLENKTRPACRRKQLEGLLDELRTVRNPLVLAGDLNTSNGDSTPTSFRREIMKRVKYHRFWTAQAIRWFNPVSLPATLLFPLKYFKNYQDPTAFHIPYILSNRESGLFKGARAFRFEDGGRFDFDGSPARTYGRRGRTLANSNQRAWKGFRPTFRFERTYGGLTGRYKLDWFLVKPVSGLPVRPFAPHFGRTLSDLNLLSEGRVSDHPPLLVDLPLGAPPSAVPAP